MNMPTNFQVTVFPVSSYVWNPGTFHLPTTKNPRESNKTHTNKSYGCIDKIEVQLPCLICDLLKDMGMLLTKN